MSLISIASSGINASQIALNVVGQNEANATTDGYSRKTTSMTSTNDGGVTVTSINRISSQYLNTQLWNANASAGYYDQYSQYLSSTEKTLTNDNMGIGTLLDNFYTTLSAASSDPDDSALRQTVLSSAQSLASGFNWISENLNSQFDNIQQQLKTNVSSVNDLTKSIADLNSQITDLKNQNGDTSSLEDARDTAVSKLSTMLNITVTQQPDSSYSITLAQGQPLVSGKNSATLSENNGQVSLMYQKQSFSIEENAGGSIGGLIDYQKDILEPTLSSLNQLATQFAEDFNNLQKSGYDVNGKQGSPLFTYTAENPSGTLNIATNFTSDDLAFSNSATDGSSNNGNLLEMLDLKNNEEDSYTTLVGSIAIKSSAATAKQNANDSLVSNVKDSIASNSGVNSNEEAANLLVYQSAYQANAKVISIASQLFSSLITMF